jgi:WD40 repeat protein
MPDTPDAGRDRLDSLLLRWEELSEAGQDIPAEELCRDCPNLAPALRQRIEALRSLRWLSQAHGNGTPPPAATDRTPLLQAGAEVIDGYRLVRRLGRGGFGEVWQADGPGGFAAALKFIPWSDRAAVEERALEIIKGVRHPHLLPTIGVWQTDAFLVIGMELADGTLLDRLNEARGQGGVGIPHDPLLAYLRQAAEGIDYLNAAEGAGGEAGRAGIQHRDIKPQNLLLVGGCVKVADFGLARLLARDATSHSGSLTLAYAAPEFFEGRTAATSDQYGLAVTYCQLRGGGVPFDGPTAQVVAGHLRRKPDLGMLPPRERPVVARALAKPPEKRWPSCRAFVEALADPPHPGRRRWLAAAAGVTGALACGGVVWHFRRGSPAEVAAGTPDEDLREPLLIRSFTMPNGHGGVRGLALSPDDHQLLTIGAGGPVVWDVDPGGVPKLLEAGPGVGAAWAGVRFGPQILTGHENGNVIWWNAATGAEQARYGGCTKSVSAVAFSPDTSLVLAAGCDHTVCLWDSKKGQKPRCSWSGHTEIAMGAAFTPTGREVVSTGWDGTVRLWDVEKQRASAKWDVANRRLWCLAVFISEGLPVALVGGDKGILKLCYLGREQPERDFGSPDDDIHGLAVSGDGRRALTGHSSGVLRLWDIASGKQECEFAADGQPVNAVAFSTDGRLAFVGSDTIHVWRLPRP